MSTWTFFSNHAHVILLLCEEPDLRMSDIAARVGITERAVQRILRDLVADKYVVVRKVGRRNHYEPQLKARLRHPLEENLRVGDLAESLRARRLDETTLS